jgi:hypothetical protein
MNELTLEFKTNFLLSSTISMLPIAADMGTVPLLSI